MILQFNNKFDTEKAKRDNIIGEKILNARQKKGWKQYTLVKILEQYNIHITSGTLCRWEKGDIIPNAYQLIALCYALGIKDVLPFFTGQAASLYPELNAAGEKAVQEYVDTLIKSGKYKHVEKKLIRYTQVKTYDLSVSAGTGNFLDSDSYEMKDFAASRVPEGTDFALKISGDSMEPSFLDGQYVFVSVTNEVAPGDVGIFILNGDAYIKMLDTVEPNEDNIEACTDSNGNIIPQPVLISFNEKYKPIYISADDSFHVCGKVL